MMKVTDVLMLEKDAPEFQMAAEYFINSCLKQICTENYTSTDLISETLTEHVYVNWYIHRHTFF